MKRVAFDIEANGLLDSVSTLHSLVLQDLDTGEQLSCAYQDGYAYPEAGLEVLSQAELICGHNVIHYDIPALFKLFPRWGYTGDVYDTLVAARTAYPDVMMFDLGSKVDKKDWGSHSLKAWGQRVGVHKTQFDLGFDEWSVTMQEYCEDDVRATAALYDFLQEERIPQEALEIEHTLAHYIFAQQEGGFPFDREKALALREKLEKDYADSLLELQEKYFRRWVEPGATKTPTRNWGRLRELLGPKAEVFTKPKGATYQEVKICEFTGGPVQIKKCLKRFYGWQPEYVKKRKRVGKTDQFENVYEEEGTDTDTLAKLNFPCIPTLIKHKQAEKVLGMLSKGDNAWLKLVKDDGRIHGRVIQNGTVTHRARHSRPNMSQVPSIGKAYGEECRELFHAPAGWKLIGCDASGLELRMLAHYMHKYDNGTYAFEILNGDIHTVNQHAAGLSTRNQSKTFIYGFLYGAGAAKVGSIVDPTAGEHAQMQIGADLKKKFLTALPALDMVIKDATSMAEGRGYVYSIDGRKTYVKSPHKALNCLLQSSGSILVKKWMCLFYKELLQAVGQPGWEGNWSPCSYSHDDVVLAVREEYVKEVSDILLRNLTLAGEQLEMKIRMDGEAKIGNTWGEVH